MPDVLRDALEGDAGEAIAGEARRNVRSRTGRTASTIDVRRDGNNAVEVGYENAQQHIGTWLESGTQAHLIRPRKGKALRFGGGVVEKSVHPGFPAQRIMSKTLRTVRPEVEAVILRDIGNLLERDLLGSRA